MDASVGVAVALKLLVVGLSLYPLTRPDSSHFRGKAMAFRAVLYPAVVGLIPITWLLAGQPSPYPVVADVALTVPLAIDAAANVLGLFAIPRFDVIPHVVGWCFLCIAFGLAVAPLVESRWAGFALVLGFGAVVDVLWELGEYLLMRSGASGLDLTYDNTIQDLAMSLVGSTVGAVVVATVLWPAPGTPETLFGWR
ncbi:MAG TPA: hypothetical protein VK867_11980 [Candidatus Limnocylindrales bacterium]|nr:hypothetical protein [Candidatus Limnocylindrales bacterium]